jgi:hypothetical protein
MTILQVLKIVAVFGTLLTGLVSVLRPRSVFDFTGLAAPGARGITEIRAILGGVFVGLGLAPLLLNSPAAYQTVGIMYLVVAVVRAGSMIVDKSIVQSNLISVVVEVIFGMILVL